MVRPVTRIVVVGAGTAGIPATLAALEAGAEVVLVEKTGRVGGMLWASGAILSGAGSRLQRSRGIEDSAEAHEREVWNAGRERAEPALLRMATDNAGATIDWLESIGTHFTADSPLRLGLADHHELYQTPRSYLLDAPAELGPYRGPVLAERLAAELDARRLDPRLSVRLETNATALQTSPDGHVTGLTVDKYPSTISADAVILCTGGYAGDQAMLRRFHPRFDRLVSQGLGHATGDGIRLAEAAGATVVNQDIVIPMLGAVEDPDRPGFRLGDAMVNFGRPPGTAGDIWINAQGRRFVAEDGESPDLLERAILEQPGATMTALFDEPMRRGLTLEIGRWTRDRLGDPPDPRLVTSAATIEELANRLQLDPATLRATVDSYNRGARTGRDQHGRTAMPAPIAIPPFHAVPTASAVIVTFAGIKVNARLEVVNRDGRPIPGLYAAGEVLGGGQVQGDGFSSGMSVTPAITLGRLAVRFALSGARHAV